MFFSVKKIRYFVYFVLVLCSMQTVVATDDKTNNNGVESSKKTTSSPKVGRGFMKSVFNIVKKLGFLGVVGVGGYYAYNLIQSNKKEEVVSVKSDKKEEVEKKVVVDDHGNNSMRTMVMIAVLVLLCISLLIGLWLLFGTKKERED